MWKGKRCNAFVYLWRDRISGKYYLGSHIGTPNDAYLCGGKDALPEITKRTTDWHRRILVGRLITKDQQIRTIESDLLSRIEMKNKQDRYYNISYPGGLYYSMKAKPVENVYEQQKNKHICQNTVPLEGAAALRAFLRRTQ